MIKVISIDLWGTLIKSNPEYKKKRAEFIALHCNKTIDEINTIISTVKRDFVDSIETFGLHYDAIDMYRVIYNICEITTIPLKKLKYICNDMFILYPPLIIDGIEETLKAFKADGYKLILSSNTTLINGNVLSVMLDNQGLIKYFDKTLYSNEIEVSKPNPLFFKKLHIESQCLKCEIVHIGDSKKCDFDGANNYGITPYFLSKNESFNLNTYNKIKSYNTINGSN